MNRIQEPVQLLDIAPGTDAPATSVLLRTESGTMTAFAFGEGQGLPEHVNLNDAVVLVLEGTADISVGDRRLTVRSGEIVHLPAGVPHALHPGAPFRMLLTLLRRPDPETAGR